LDPLSTSTLEDFWAKAENQTHDMYAFLLLASLVTAYHRMPPVQKQSGTQLHLFNFFGNKKDAAAAPAPTTPATTAPASTTRGGYKLEKISRTQNRDYEAEAKASGNYGRDKPVVVRDKQAAAFNFNKPNEFPNLYKGWIKADGDQIGKQMVASAKAALGAKEKYVEILFDPVPNLDEVAFGTVWNKKFRMEVAANLQVPDYATNRGGPATLEWSNVYWANRLAAGLGR
jgi:hypothetical protein